MFNLKMKLNRKLLPMKGHFFLFNAGTAPLVPYLSTYARQLGFSSSTVGLIYTILPISGLVAKPLFGAIADRFKLQKHLFILFQIITAVSFLGIYFIPEAENNVKVKLECRDSGAVIMSCYQHEDSIDGCKVASLRNDTTSSFCNMSCDTNFLNPNNITIVQQLKFSSHIADVKNIENNCVSIIPKDVIVDGFSYDPHCSIFDDFMNIENCSIKYNVNKSDLEELVQMSCSNQTVHYNLCSNYSAAELEVTSDCEISCNWKGISECAGLQMTSPSCQDKSKDTSKHFLFSGLIPHSTINVHRKCLTLDLHEIHLPGETTIHNPTCQGIKYKPLSELPWCNISCDKTELQELFQAASDGKSEDTTQYTKQFWLFFLLMIISWVGQAVVVSIADAICFNLLGSKPAYYGRQRLWGSVGWGIFSLLTGTLIDVYSNGANKDYTIAFVLMFIFMSFDVVASCFIKNKSTNTSSSILADIGGLLTSLHIVVFLLWTIAVGLSTGLLWQFLFWHLEDISGLSCEGSTYVKTLQGLVSAIQSFCGEIPFMFLSGTILKRLGHVHMMSLVLFAFGLRFILYSFLTNPWWVLPIEMLQGVTFGMFYPTMTSYASIIAPPGVETTVQGLTGAVFEGIGASLGSFIGGHLYEIYGGWTTFRWFGYGSLACCALNIIVQYFIGRNTPKGMQEVVPSEEKTPDGSSTE